MSKHKVRPREPLPATAPKSLKGRARTLYASLAAVLRAEGWTGASDLRTVLMTVEVELHAERLASEVARLESLTMISPRGERLHPLVAELRATRAQLANLYSSLFLTPRTRSACRVTEKMKHEQFAQPDELDDFLNA